MAITPEEIVRQGYECYARRDLAGVLELLAPDVEMIQTHQLPWGGGHRGLDGARRFFAALDEHTDARARPLRFVPAGDEVVVIAKLTGTARRTGREFDLDIVHVCTVRDGRIARVAAFMDTPAMLQALGPDALAAAPDHT